MILVQTISMRITWTGINRRTRLFVHRVSAFACYVTTYKSYIFANKISYHDYLIVAKIGALACCIYE